MTVYISGGSNSLSRSGWVSRYQDRNPGAVNISIGGTNTLISILRVTTNQGIGRGDTLVWEYALNDSDHIRSGFSRKILLRYLEHLILLARDRGLAFAPVIFTPRNIESRPTRTKYYQQVFRLFDHYGLDTFDMSTSYRAHLGVKILPSECFKGMLHYIESDDVLNFIADGVENAVAQAKVPRTVKPLFVGRDRLRLLTDFTDQVFTNSILDLATATPPIQCALPGRGEITALAFLTRAEDCAVELSVVGGRRSTSFAVSTSAKVVKNVRRMLKVANFEHARGKPWTYPEGSVLDLRQWTGSGRIYAETHCKGMLNHPTERPVSEIAGVFVTTYAPGFRFRWPDPAHRVRTFARDFRKAFGKSGSRPAT